ncbi:uncharacterized protein LOC115632681 [Scaptodrosophila lebanonensis]|uniref:Uncharacterized protein LOC115632681 n=1 Tax=Drosophila lebanonensis TaxID=7225 RepID=A0A6J2UCH7_DROLE|nr:uncharacterized protein LOC115632681 [Scaptodrosophila lebanonensis]
MKLLSLCLWSLSLAWAASSAAIEKTNEGQLDNGEKHETMHFGFETENGHQRSENITYMIKSTKSKVAEDEKVSEKPVEYRGGYSFISADGYRYQVLYKANSKGFQPYVTAHKIKPANELEKQPEKQSSKQLEKQSEKQSEKVPEKQEKIIKEEEQLTPTT